MLLVGVKVEEVVEPEDDSSSTTHSCNYGSREGLCTFERLVAVSVEKD